MTWGKGAHQQPLWAVGQRPVRDQSHACLLLLPLPRRDELIHGAHVGLSATGGQGVHQCLPEIVRGPENATKVTCIL